MLEGRETEREAIETLLRSARRGSGGALVVRGEAGIGKSALLEDAARRAAGATVLRARSVEAESALPFAGLLELLASLLPRLDRLAPRQRGALAGALALGPPEAQDPLAVYAGVLSLLAAGADDGPVVALVDDAHWLDDSSRDALLFAARRLGGEAVAIVFAVRDPESEHAFDRSGLRQLPLGGLGREAAEALLARGPALAPAVARKVVEVAAGNPLALLEIPRLLTADQRAGRESIVGPLPAGPGLEAAFRRRLEALPAESAQALLVLAAADHGAPAVVEPALRALGLDVAALAAAESDGLLRAAAGNWHFAHPLVRSAVYHGADAASRRRAHRALAAADRGGARRAWHLAAAAAGPDERAAAALEEAALESTERLAHAEAAAALARAAALTASPEERARRLLKAARAFGAAGRRDVAAEALDEAASLAADPVLLASLHQLRRRDGAEWPHDDFYDALVAEAEAIASLDAAQAASLLVDASTSAREAGDAPRALGAARAAVALVRGSGGWTEAAAEASLAFTLVQAAQEGEARPLLERCSRRLEDQGWIAAAPLLPAQVAGGFVWLEEYDRARSVADEAVRVARAAGAASALAFQLQIRSELDFRTGRWRNALADAAECVALIRALGRPPNLYRLARLEAVLGREEDCRRHADEQERQLGAEGGSGHALGLLELGLGRPDEAVVHLEEAEPYGWYDEPGALPWVHDLVEAYARSGRVREAERLLARLDAQARRSGRAWALAVVARCRGLLAPTDFDRPFGTALAWHARSAMPFERARTELCYGERLRRARRRVEARRHLRSALDTFGLLGAEPWAARALRELRASGETARRREVSTLDDLTPQELQVARVVVDGATNKEAAAALFVSPKTIEFHLANAYRKLGVRSRTQLARLLAGREATAA